MKMYLEAHGCSLNHGETDLLGRMAMERGWEMTSTADEADLLVISTCVVVQGTESKLYERIKSMAASGKQLIVYGCMVNVLSDRVRELAPTAKQIPTSDIMQFGKILETVGPPMRINDGRVHENVPIANGCRGKCTYCIARLARGELRSRPIGAVLGHVTDALSVGRREIRLTAQDTAIYGLDLKEGETLPSLIRNITSLDGDFRVRVGMMNPDSAMSDTRQLLWALLDPKVYKFLHMPVQSGSDEVLARMGRRYSVREFVEIVVRFRETIPELYLSTDIIAGFPGETESDHEATLKLVEAIQPDVLNLKAFSARPGTDAKSMPGRIDTSVVKKRTEELHELKKRISFENLATQKDREMDVLLTERPRPGSTMGRSMEYRPIVINGDALLGTIVRVKVTGQQGDYLLGTQV